jgi:hypothetical protein
MADRIPIRLTRPYASVEEFVRAEGWTVGKNGVVLIGHPPLTAGTEVRCEIVLASGEPMIRAEGSVVRPVAPSGERPGGLQIRFQRVTPATKAFIKRVGDLRAAEQGERNEPASDVQAASPPVPAEPARLPVPRSAPAWDYPRGIKSGGASRALDALRIRAGQSIQPPTNRSELLRRLRERKSS